MPSENWVTGNLEQALETRANGFPILAGGVVITFAKGILNLITG